jgi:hypothetical protein
VLSERRKENKKKNQQNFEFLLKELSQPRRGFEAEKCEKQGKSTK